MTKHIRMSKKDGEDVIRRVDEEMRELKQKVVGMEKRSRQGRNRIETIDLTSRNSTSNVTDKRI